MVTGIPHDVCTTHGEPDPFGEFVFGTFCSQGQNSFLNPNLVQVSSAHTCGHRTHLRESQWDMLRPLMQSHDVRGVHNKTSTFCGQPAEIPMLATIVHLLRRFIVMLTAIVSLLGRFIMMRLR